MSVFLPNTPRLRVVLGVLDGLALVAAGWAAHGIRFIPVVRTGKLSFVLERPLFIVATLVVLWVLAVAAELYEPASLRRRGELAVRVATVAAAWAGATVVATYLVPSWRFGRGLLALTAGGWALLAVAIRAAFVRWMSRRGREVALVVGAEEDVAGTCARLERHPLTVWRPVPVSAAEAAGVAEKARRSGAGLVVIVGAPDRSGLSVESMAALHFSGVPVVVASEIWAWLEGRLPLDGLSFEAFLHQPGFSGIHWKLFNRLTRLCDVLIAGVMLVVTLPILAAAALAVLAFHGRPVLFRQVRVGQYGDEFTLLKLRTMRRDAEEDGPAFSGPADPRVTRVGAVLRRLRIDELPQLVNVLRGEMSMVGPRPERPEFVTGLAEAIPFYAFRLAVPPGLTGWAQVNMPYARSIEDHRLRLEYDLYFIRERSMTLYLLTLLRTVSAALAGTER